MGLFGFGKKKESSIANAPPISDQFSSNALDNPQAQAPQNIPPLTQNPQEMRSMDPQAFSSPLEQTPAAEAVAQEPLPSFPEETGAFAGQAPVQEEAQPKSDLAQAPPQDAAIPAGQEAQVNPFVTPPADNPQVQQAPAAPEGDSFDLPDFTAEDLTPKPAPVVDEPVAEPVAETVIESALPPRTVIEQETPVSAEPEMEVVSEPQTSFADEPVEEEVQPAVAEAVEIEDDLEEPLQPTAPPVVQEQPQVQPAFAEEAENLSAQVPAQEDDMAPIMPGEHEKISDTIPVSDNQSFSLQESMSQEGIAPLQEEPQPVEDRVVVTSDSGKIDIFVEKGTYQQALLSLAEIESDTGNAADHLTRVIDDESIVTAKITEWHDVMNEIQQKLIAADTKLFDKGEEP